MIFYKMKKFFLSILFIGTIFVASNIMGQIECPGLIGVVPFLKNINYVPAPDCYYRAQTTQWIRRNKCRIIFAILKKKLPGKISSWECFYKPGDYYQYLFNFVYEPKKKH